MILIRLMDRSPVLHIQSCKLLDDVINWVMDSSGETSIEIFGSLLPAITAALVSAIEKQAERAGLVPGMIKQPPPSPLATLDHFDVGVRDMASSSYAERAIETHRLLLRLLNKLLCSGPNNRAAPWQKNLSRIDPIPKKYGMEEASNSVAAHREQLEPWRLLHHFTLRAASMSSTSRELSLSVLRSLLNSGKFLSLETAEVSKLNNIWDDPNLYWHPNSRQSLTGALHPLIKTAAWKLARLSGELADDNLADFAGQLLALVGPLPENEMSIGVDCTWEDGMDGRQRVNFNSSSLYQKLDATSLGIVNTFAAAIHLMSEYTIDENASIVEITQNTLRMTLQLHISKEVLSILPIEVRSVVDIFSSDALEQPTKSMSRLADPELWDVARYCTYNDWVCTLTHAFLETVSFHHVRLLLHVRLSN